MWVFNPQHIVGQPSCPVAELPIQVMQVQPLTSSFAGNEKSYQNELLSFSFNLMLCNSCGQAMQPQSEGSSHWGVTRGPPRLLGQLNGRAGLSTQRDRWTGGTQSFEWHLKAAGIIDTFKEVFESGMWSRDSRGTEKALLRIFLFVKWSKIQPSLIMEAGSLARLIHLISLLIKLCSNLVSQGNPSESVLPTCATDTGLWKISPSRETWVRQSFSLIPSLHNESTTDSIRPGRAKIELLTK